MAYFVKNSKSLILPNIELLEATSGRPSGETEYFDSAYRNAIALRDTLKRHRTEIGFETRVFDFGCGTGRIVFPLEDICGCQIIGIDRKAEHVQHAELHNPGKSVFFLSQDLPPLQFENDYFDIAYSFSVFTHFNLPTFQMWVREIFRVLRPNGVFVISLRGEEYFEVLCRKKISELMSKGYVVEGSEYEFQNDCNIYLTNEKILECFYDFELLEHRLGPVEFSPRPKKYTQDVWVFRKSNV